MLYWYKPSIVLGIQQEISADDGNTDGDDDENKKH